MLQQEPIRALKRPSRLLPRKSASGPGGWQLRLKISGRGSPWQSRRKRAGLLERTSGAPPMIVVTTENVAGHRTVQTLGQCFGVVVRSRGLGGNLIAGLRTIIGGEIHEYTQLLEEARRHALDRLVQNATAMGANAVLMMRYDSAEIGNTMSEIVAYGTAAVIEPVP
jgi:uncharacterized protein YbjQ (UPF0145 family)